MSREGVQETYFDEESQTYCDVPRFVYASGTELLKIFPEARRIIPKKIAEWQAIKQGLLDSEVAPTLKKIEALPDAFSRWFWKEAYKILVNPAFVDAVINLERLERLRILLRNKGYMERTKNIARKKELAKQMPIQQFYAFQRLRKVGRRYQALCPFHREKTASFVIYPENIFHCFGCGAHGDSIGFVQRIKECSFQEALSLMVE